MALHLLTASILSFSGTSTHAVPWQNSFSWRLPTALRLEVQLLICLWSHLCPAHLQLLVWLNCQLNTRCRENSLLHHPHNKSHSKPFMLCMVFFLLYWTLIILLEIISPILINDFSKSAGTILFGTESLKFYIFYVLSYTLILKCDWINLKNISLFLKC